MEDVIINKIDKLRVNVYSGQSAEKTEEDLLNIREILSTNKVSQKVIINDKIKLLFNTKRDFCLHIGQRYGDLGNKLRTVQKKIEWLNSFLKPLNLRVEITENDSVGKKEKECNN